jgi:hypothetical protein
MTVLTKRLAAVAAGAVPSMGVFGPKRAGDRLAGSKGAWLEQSGPSFADPTRYADSSTTLGFLFTVGLAIGLMALVFFSDRSGRDDETNRAGER